MIMRVLVGVFHNQDGRQESRECFPIMNAGSNWVKHCRNYEIKGKFVPCHRQFRPGNDYPRTKGSLRTCCYHYLERDHRIGKHFDSTFFWAQRYSTWQLRLSSYQGIIEPKSAGRARSFSQTKINSNVKMLYVLGKSRKWNRCLKQNFQYACQWELNFCSVIQNILS